MSTSTCEFTDPSPVRSAYGNCTPDFQLPGACFITIATKLGTDAAKVSPLDYTFTPTGLSNCGTAACNIKKWPDKFKQDCCLGNYKDGYRCNPKWCPQKYDTGVCDDKMIRYCTESADPKYCRIDPLTGKQAEKCSRMTSTDPADANCIIWANSAKKRGVFDPAITMYCSKPDNVDAPECKCANRSYNKEYRATGIGHVINDGCWYLPCKDDENYLVPSSLDKPSCPKNMCQQVYNIVKNRYVKIDDVKNVIDCNFDSFKPKPDPDPTPDPTPDPDPTPTPTPTPGESFIQRIRDWIQKNKLAAGGIVGAIVFILVLLVIVIARS